MADKKVPARLCVGCREMKQKKDMVRVLKTTEGEICIDETGRKNGRGAYICKSNACLQSALKSKGLEKSLKVSIPAEIVETLTKEMSEIAE